MSAVAHLKADQSILAGGPARLIERCGEAVQAADKILLAAKSGVRVAIEKAGGIDAAQHAAHGLAWLATTVEGLRQMHSWAVRMNGEGRFGEFEQLLLLVAFSEYCAQIAGGIPMSQVERSAPMRWVCPRPTSASSKTALQTSSKRGQRSL